jgi:dimethylhistidine N-methyltransferase
MKEDDLASPAPEALADRLVLVETGAGLASDFAADVRAGLTARKKRLSCRYLYDATGSALFERICELPEYYLTRAELSILQARADAIVADSAPDAALVELGSGSATKTRTLIEAMLRRRDTLRYVPIDISRAILTESARALVADYATLEVHGIAAEYRAGLRLLRRQRAQPKLVLWLGSNVGNFNRADAARFLRGVRATLSDRDRLLMGVDLRKPPAVLEAAYDDAAGVTARFNLNLLARANRELGGDFELDAFAHRARWNERWGRVEMHLVSRRRQRVRIARLDLEIDFADGEGIFTESSYKYSLDEIERLARASGFVVEQHWRDRDRRFSVNLLAPQSS